jgi:alkanesulfonate monooxygenase SsuD/methylene tetrahydromethanopterin reductase-like flavin-dependent oxidoreductase (luciferase family)
MTKAPEFGLLHDFRQKAPFSQGSASYYAECLAEIQEAEALGYQAVWLSEHQFTPDGFLPSPLVVAAATAVRTSRIGISPTRLRREDFLVGTPEEVAERLIALHHQTPYDHFAFWGRLPGFSHEEALRSIGLFASDVAPTVRTRLASR